MNRLLKLNERYTAANLTGFRLVDVSTSEKTVLRHIDMDLAILKSSAVKEKELARVIIRDGCIDICSYDNGTPISYFFSEDAYFTPKDISSYVEELCGEYDVGCTTRFENLE